MDADYPNTGVNFACRFTSIVFVIAFRGGESPLSLVVYFHYLYLIVDRTSPQEYQVRGAFLGAFLATEPP